MQPWIRLYFASVTRSAKRNSAKGRSSALANHATSACKSEELLLSTHVARRSEELVERREQLRSERAEHEEALEQVHALLDLCEWAAKAIDEIAEQQAELDRLKSLQAEAASLEEESRALEAAVAQNRSLANRLEEPLAVEERLSASERQIEVSADRLKRLPAELEQAQHKLGEEQARLEQARALEPKYLRRYKLPSQEEQAAAVAQAEREMEAASSIREEASRQLAEQQAILTASQDAGALRRRIEGATGARRAAGHGRPGTGTTRRRSAGDRGSGSRSR